MKLLPISMLTLSMFLTVCDTADRNLYRKWNIYRKALDARKLNRSLRSCWLDKSGQCCSNGISDCRYYKSYNWRTRSNYFNFISMPYYPGYFWYYGCSVRCLCSSYQPSCSATATTTTTITTTTTTPTTASTTTTVSITTATTTTTSTTTVPETTTASTSTATTTTTIPTTTSLATTTLLTTTVATTTVPTTTAETTTASTTTVVTTTIPTTVTTIPTTTTDITTTTVATPTTTLTTVSTTTTIPTTTAANVTTRTLECGHADVVFLLDSSDSVGRENFTRELDFVSNFIQNFTIGASDTQFSVVTFGSTATNQFNLDQYNNTADLQGAIGNISYISGGTNTAAGLSFVRQESFLTANGGRDTSHQIVIVITDGQSADMTATADEAALLHDLGVNVFSVGVGNDVNIGELEKIASNNDTVFTVADFENLADLTLSLQDTTCTTGGGNGTGTGTGTVCQADIAFVLDSSETADFPAERDYVSNFAQNFTTIGPTGVQFGVVTIGSTPTEQINLNQFSDLTSLQTAISNIPFDNAGTNIPEALGLLVTTTNALPNGGRQNVPQIVVVITDGESGNIPMTTENAQNLANNGIQVFAVGVGPQVNNAELQAIASDPSNVISVPDFNSLADASTLIQNAACP